MNADRAARLLLPVDDGPDPEPEVEELPRSEVPERPDRVARAVWEREVGDGLPLDPPYDLEERLARDARDAAYLIEQARSHHRLAATWHERYLVYENALRRIVMAADRGGTLTQHLDAARELLPKTRYKRPPR